MTIAGDGRRNRLTVTGGMGVITGGEGSDVLEGGPSGRHHNSRDGSPDTVICNGGTDTVLADTLDLVSPSCENVQIQASPGGPFDDRAAVARLDRSRRRRRHHGQRRDHARGQRRRRPRRRARCSSSTTTACVCEDPTAPYACAYQPRGGDVGRNTLIAVAVDGAGQTTSVVRAVTVRRFAPKALSLVAAARAATARAPYAFRLTGTLRAPRRRLALPGLLGHGHDHRQARDEGHLDQAR